MSPDLLRQTHARLPCLLHPLMLWPAVPAAVVITPATPLTTAAGQSTNMQQHMGPVTLLKSSCHGMAHLDPRASEPLSPKPLERGFD